MCRIDTCVGSLRVYNRYVCRVVASCVESLRVYDHYMCMIVTCVGPLRV